MEDLAPMPYMPWPDSPGVWECEYQGERVLCFVVKEGDGELKANMADDDDWWTGCTHGPTNFLRTKTEVAKVASYPEKPRPKPKCYALFRVIRDNHVAWLSPETRDGWWQFSGPGWTCNALTLIDHPDNDAEAVQEFLRQKGEA